MKANYYDELFAWKKSVRANYVQTNYIPVDNCKKSETFHDWKNRDVVSFCRARIGVSHDELKSLLNRVKKGKANYAEFELAKANHFAKIERLKELYNLNYNSIKEFYNI